MCASVATIPAGGHDGGMDLLESGPADGPTLLFAHGAGAAMDSPGMSAIVDRLTSRGIRVVRFEFGYMAARRDGMRRPPPRADSLVGEFAEAARAVGGRPVIGGKSMGGRVATLVADELGAPGVVCVGYPFHPPAKPEQLRTAHLERIRTPMLVCQGTRDPFGSIDEVAGYALSPSIEVRWFDDGDHDLRPRKAVSGRTHREHLDASADAVAAFVRGVAGSLDSAPG